MIEDLGTFLEQLHELPYVTKAFVKPVTKAQLDGVLELRVRGARFEFPLEVKRSYLSKTMTNALISLSKRERPLMLFAHYISRPTGECLADAGINFVDKAGNLHVSLGRDYYTLILGKQDKRRKDSEHKRLSAATVQVLFACLVEPNAIARPVRDLATLAGVGKTAAAEARQRLVDERILLDSTRKDRRPAEMKQLQDWFLEGYHRILRPHLFIGRYRSRDRDPNHFVERFAEFAQQNSLDWALTGGAGAAELDRFYRGDETSLFVGDSSGDVPRLMALLPDRKGPITLLRFFSPLIIFPRSEGWPVGHPWLLYAELLQHDDPRALEAAEEIRTRYLRA